MMLVRFRHAFPAVALAALLAPPVHALETDPPPAPLTLSEAASAALARYPTVAAARSRGEAAVRGLDEARAARLPWLSLGASATKFEKPMIVTPIHGFTSSDIPPFDDLLLQGSLTADWLLFDGGGRGARIDRQESLARAADANVEASEAAIVGRTLMIYLRVLGLAAKLDAHDRRLAALEAEDARVRRLADVGRVAEVDLRRAAAALEAARAGRVAIASGLDVTERELARLVGRDVETVQAGRLVAVELVEDLTPPREVLLAEALGASPEIRSAEARLQAAEAELDGERSVRWPSLHAVGNVLGYASSRDDLVTEWNAGVRLQLPLFTGGAISDRVGRSRAGRDAAESELASSRLAVEAELDAALGAVEEARARAASLAAAVANFAEVARIERLRLDTESGTQTDWLTAEAELLVARAQLVDAEFAGIVARADLARIAGTLSPEWIDLKLEAR
jgi:outer membrane protein